MADLDARARQAVWLRLEFLLRARLELAAQDAAESAFQPEQLEWLRALRQPVLLVLLRQPEQVLAARQLERVHAELPEQLARQPAQVSRARRQLAPRLRAHHASLLSRLLPSRPFPKLRQLPRQLQLALTIGSAS